MKQLSKKFAFVILVSSLLGGCAFFKKENSQVVFGNKEYADAFVSSIEPKWFKGAERFAIIDQQKKPVVHRFFDVNPFKNIESGKVNVVITTPADSEFLNQIDLTSGQIFIDEKFCSQKDEFAQLDGDVENNKFFSLGVLPRVLDQLNDPQKVVVFGGEEYIKKHYKSHSFDVRVIGGFVEQVCPFGGCFKADQWLSRIVLVAIQNGDEKLKDVVDIVDLQNKVDWNYFRAFIQNGQGKNKISGKYFARNRMGAIVSAKQALSYINKNSTIFSIDKLKQMRLSCYKLYDYLWKDLSYESTSSMEAKNLAQVREKAILLNQKRKEGMKDDPFWRRFAKNNKKFGKQYNTCVQYVNPTNINDDPKRHWFFSYLTAFHSLQNLGYAFNCNRKVWEVNPVVIEGKRVKSLQEQFRNCSDKDLDRAFEYAPSMFDTLRKGNRVSYRYIDYDSGSKGTHHKIYNWVKLSPGSMSCREESERNFSLERSIFPKDVVWEKRGKSKKINSAESGVIY